MGPYDRTILCCPETLNLGYCLHPVTVYIRGPIKGYIYIYTPILYLLSNCYWVGAVPNLNLKLADHTPNQEEPLSTKEPLSILRSPDTQTVASQVAGHILLFRDWAIAGPPKCTPNFVRLSYFH